MTSPFKQSNMEEHKETTGPNDVVFDSIQLREERQNQADKLRELAKQLQCLWIQWDILAHKNRLYEARANGMYGVEKAHGIRRTYQRLEEGLDGMAAIMWERTAQDMSVDTGSPSRK